MQNAEKTEKMKNKRLAINFFASIVTYGVTALINFFLSPYIVSRAGEAAYGFISLATTFTSYATIVSTAINSMSSRFVAEASVQKKHEEANQYFVSTMVADALLGVLFLCVGGIVVLQVDKILNVPTELLSDVRVLFALVFLSFIINTLGSVFEIGYFVTNKLYIASVRQIVTALIRAVVVVTLFVLLPVHIYYMGIGLALISLIAMIYNVRMSKKLLPFVKYTKSAFKLSFVQRIASAGIWNSVNMLGTTLTEGLDLLICNVFLSPSLMGVMSLSKTVPGMLKSIQATVVGIFTPETVNRYAENDFQGMKQYLNYSTRVMRAVLCVPFGVFGGLGYAFYSLWIPDVDANILQALSLLSLMAVIFAIGVSPIYNIFTAANKLKLPSIVHLIGGACSTVIVLILLNTTDLGVYAVAGVSSVVDIIKTFFVILPFAAHLIDEKPTFFWSSAFKAAGACILVALPGWIFTRFILIQEWWQLIATGIVYAIVAYGVVLVFGLTPQERKNLKEKLFRRANR